MELDGRREGGLGRTGKGKLGTIPFSTLEMLRLELAWCMWS